jgi:hypothetical protein
MTTAGIAAEAQQAGLILNSGQHASSGLFFLNWAPSRWRADDHSAAKWLNLLKEIAPP